VTNFLLLCSKMGSCYKKIFNDHVQQGVLGWAQKAKMKGVKTGAGAGAGALASKADSAGPSVKIEMATKAPAGNDDAVININ
jgi:mlo protein